jgi:hypothetical protein
VPSKAQKMTCQLSRRRSAAGAMTVNFHPAGLTVQARGDALPCLLPCAFTAEVATPDCPGSGWTLVLECQEARTGPCLGAAWDAPQQAELGPVSQERGAPVPTSTPCAGPQALASAGLGTRQPGSTLQYQTSVSVLCVQPPYPPGCVA